MKDFVNIEGEVENIIYYNSDNGYCIFSVINKEDGEEIVCTASTGELHLGEILCLNGKYIEHPEHGHQLKVADFEKRAPETTEGMYKYLASGAIKGIGAKTALKMINKFGDQTFEVIENYPEKLLEIKGIPLSKAHEISRIFHEQADKRAALLFLQSYGISPSFSAKIIEKYGKKTIETIKLNPYKLAEDISGIGFKTADAIAHRLGVEYESKHRIKSGITYCLTQAAGNGHTYLPKEELINSSAEVLSVPKELIDAALIELQIEKSIIQENHEEYTAVFSNHFFYAENYVAKKLLDLSLNTTENTKYIEEEIKQVEAELKIELAKNQRTAVSEAMTKGVLVITGGPGTGKTTTLNTIIALLKKEGYEIELAAPTGRAAKRMSEATGEPAKTIHRLLEYKPGADGYQSFERSESNPLETDVIIVDESSMVDIMLMFHLLKATETGTRLILVGDSDQLPSVGPGNVLKDIITSKLIKTIRLDEIFRQSLKSLIVLNAHKINSGEYPEINNKESDFFFVKRPSAYEVESTVLELASKRLPKFKGYTNIKDIQILTPMKKSVLGALNLNKSLQKALNPPSPLKREYEYRDTVFREGDKVMQIKNNYQTQWTIYDENHTPIEEDKGVFNGDEGLISHIDLKKENMTVIFDDNKVVTYPFAHLDELTLGYAVTIHKSQGSEYKTVIIPVFNGPQLLLNRNLLYTAITRARELVVLVGIEETIKYMVDNNREINRYSSLHKKIIKFGHILSGMGEKPSSK